MVIHLIAPKDKSKWNDTWFQCYHSWTGYPFEIRMWHDEDVDQLLKEDDEEFFNILNSLHPIYKWDYVRYVILEKFGGAYFDMDVKIVDASFFKKLDRSKVYIMEGTVGTYLENSIMITPHDSPLTEYWKRLKFASQHNIKTTPNHKLTPDNVIWTVGPGLLSKFFMDATIMTGNQHWEVLGYNQFASTTNTLVYTRHYNTSMWNREELSK